MDIEATFPPVMRDLSRLDEGTNDGLTCLSTIPSKASTTTDEEDSVRLNYLLLVAP